MDDLEVHTHAHCRGCMEGRQTERTQVGLSSTGLVIYCKKHGLIAHFSPDQLREQLAKGPQCACCPGGMHRN